MWRTNLLSCITGLLFTSSPVLTRRTLFGFDGQTESVDDGQERSSDLSQLLASVSLNEFVFILADTNPSTDQEHAASSDHHYEDLNGFLITITRHNKIMQIFTTQTSKRRVSREIVVANNLHLDGDGNSRKAIRRRRRLSHWNEEISLGASSSRANLMGQFMDVKPFTTSDNTTLRHRLLRPRPLDSVNIEKDSLLPLPLQDKLSGLRAGTGVILVIDNVEQLPDFSGILQRDMSAIKFVLYAMRANESEDQRRSIEGTIEAFMQQLWRLHHVYHVFFIGFVSGQRTSSATGEALFYNPFIRNSGGSGDDGDPFWQQQWGQLDKISINCGLSNSLISNNGVSATTATESSSSSFAGARNESLGESRRKENINGACSSCPRRSVGRINYHNLVDYIDLITSVGGVGMNYNGYPLTGIIFPSTMTSLREESAILRKTLVKRKEGKKVPLEKLFFGLDVDVALELARRLNFTLNATASSDAMDYGYLVRYY